MAHDLIADIGLWSLSMNRADHFVGHLRSGTRKHVTRALTLDCGKRARTRLHSFIQILHLDTMPMRARRARPRSALIRVMPQANLYLGDLYLYLGEPNAAIEEQEILRNLSPRDPLTSVVDSFQNLATQRGSTKIARNSPEERA